MYAIVDVAGEQCRVEKSAVIQVPRLNEDPGKKVSFDKVLMIVDEEHVNIGHPFVTHAVVTATVVEHTRAKKVLVFKKKRRKGHQKLNGHKQDYSEIKIESIRVGVKTAEDPEAAKAKKPAAKVVVDQPKAAAKTAAAKSGATTKPKTAAKPKAQTAVKKTAPEKPATPKAASEKNATGSEKKEA